MAGARGRMNPRRCNARRLSCAATALSLSLALTLLSACASKSVKPGPALGAPTAGSPATRKGPIISASHEDWRALIPVPFGSGLPQVQFPLKEVILFQGESRGPVGSDEQECYSKSGSPFAFRGAETEDYVLCFFHERLFEVEAALRLPRDVPAETFGQWCDDWLSGLTDVSRDAERCEGRESDTQVSATLAYDSEVAGPLLTVVIADIPAHDAYERRPQKPVSPVPP